VGWGVSQKRRGERGDPVRGGKKKWPRNGFLGWELTRGSGAKGGKGKKEKKKFAFFCSGKGRGEKKKKGGNNCILPPFPATWEQSAGQRGKGGERGKAVFPWPTQGERKKKKKKKKMAPVLPPGLADRARREVTERGRGKNAAIVRRKEKKRPRRSPFCLCDN